MESEFMVRLKRVIGYFVEAVLLGLCLEASVYGLVQLGDNMPLGV